jgi:hypothetical protein
VKLRDKGNTVIVVEHDPDDIKATICCVPGRSRRPSARRAVACRLSTPPSTT